MKRTLPLVLLSLCGVTAMAQRPRAALVRLQPRSAVATVYSSVLWTWTAPSTGAAGYNLYQAPVACPASRGARRRPLR